MSGASTHSPAPRYFTEHAPVSIGVARQASFRSDTRLLAELDEVIRGSYVDTRALLQREVQHCDTLYTARADGELVAFFLVAWESLPIDGISVPSVYLGLSGTKPRTKNSGIVRDLYGQFCIEARSWEHQHQVRLVLWYTTATPSACLAAYSLFAEAEPRVDGSFTPHGLSVVTAIRTRYQYPLPDGHPFVFRGVAVGTRYSDDERARIARVTEASGFTLLSQIGVREDQGDRLVYVCRVPDAVTVQQEGL